MSKYVIKLLEWLHYDVKDKNGQTNKKLNLFDLLLILIYVVISTYNIIISNPGILMIIVNTVSLFRLIIKTYLEQMTLYKFTEGGFMLLHTIKIVVFCVPIILLVISSFFLIVSGERSIGVSTRYIVFLIILFESLIDTLTVIEKLYDAEQNVYNKNKK